MSESKTHHLLCKACRLTARAGGFLALGFIATAQAEYLQLTEQDYYGELPIVLYASRLQQPLDSLPNAVTVIDQDMIKASTAMTIPELLRLVPGFQVANASGNETVTTYHGISDYHARRMQVLIDGRSVYIQTFGGLVWDVLPISIEDIERIEVVRGTNAASYGSNAFLGVINIVTKNPSAVKGSVIRTDIGEDGRFSTIARTTQHQGAFAYSLSAQYVESDGFVGRYDDLQAGHVNFRGDWQINARDSLELGFGYRHTIAGQGFADDPVQPIRDRLFDSHYESVKWKRIFGVDDELQVHFYHNALRLKDAAFIYQFNEFARFIDEELKNTPLQILYQNAFKEYENDPRKVGIDYSFIDHRYDLEIQRIQPLGENARLVWGGGFRSDQSDANGLIGAATITRDQWRAFGNLEWSLTPQTLLHLGAMVEDANDLASTVSPRIALNQRLNDNHSLRLSAARAYRYPSMFESYAEADFLWEDGAKLNCESPSPSLYPSGPCVRWYSSGVPMLGPEKMDAYEIGYFGRFMNDRITLDIKLFDNQLTRMIDGENQPNQSVFLGLPVNVYGNNWTARHRGLETQLQYRDAKNFWHLAHSYVDVTESRSRDNVTTPQHTLSLLYSRLLMPDTRVSIAGFYVDDMEWMGEGDPLDAIHWVDLKIQKDFRFKASKLNFALTVQNLFDNNFANFRDENIEERRFFLTARLAF